MTLFLVSSPIGNLSDLSERVASTLSSVEVIAAEDTRHTRKLLSHLGISAHLTALHEHNEKQRIPVLVRTMLEGKSVALISDAGTPCVADPGYQLVRAAVDAGITVTPIPGPSAVISALVVSGLPTDRFRFDGFLPKQAMARKQVVSQLIDEAATTVFFESPKRIIETLELVRAVIPNRHVAVARELTKLHEEVLRGTAEEVLAVLSERASIKGEITLVVAGNTNPATPEEQEIRRVAEVLRREGLAPAVVRRLGATLLGVPKKVVFETLLRGESDPEGS